jgi:hypothetical protein
VPKLDAIIRRWNSAQLPEDATFLAMLPRSFHAIRDVENNRSTRLCAFHERYCLIMHSIIVTRTAYPTKEVRRILIYLGYDRVQSHRARPLQMSPRPLMCLLRLTYLLRTRRRNIASDTYRS